MNQTTDKDLSTKDNILNATLEIIKHEGLEHVTLRKITSMANVNLALVNYYFGSKEKLISEALKILLGSLADGVAVLDDESVPPLERYKRFVLFYAESFRKQPELIKQLLGKGNVVFDTQYEYIAYLKKLGGSPK